MLFRFKGGRWCGIGKVAGGRPVRKEAVTIGHTRGEKGSAGVRAEKCTDGV